MGTTKKVSVSEDLLKVKDLIGRASHIRVRNLREEILTQLKELGYRMNEIEKKIKKNESSVTLKRKKQIIFLLKEKKMTAGEVGKYLNLSRNRANEFLKALERDGIVSWIVRGRKKYFFIESKAK